ncbi:NFAT activation molecule 1 isoform X2 [Bos javanicus]|uniref:NFAT activation molecule 1 isoform X2 n=1 Tax=Bos javanicus TaxID=9906 RepID=UPI002AA7D6D9|nr:NFAT activation molecule 1 isoform X2 [Bos javanicus]
MTTLRGWPCSSPLVSGKTLRFREKTTPDSLKRFSPGACPSLGCTGDAQNNPKSTLGCSCSPDLLVCGDGPGAAPAVLKERSVTHTGLPILVSLANRAVSFSCSITYPYTPKFKDFRVSYFHVDLQGQTSSEKKISCQPGPGSENQTHTTACPIFLKLPNSSATGTYYCSVYWQDSRMIGEGTFILVRDTGYQEPPQSPQKLLLFCFVGILAVLSILATALLLWKKRQIWALWKHTAKKCPGPNATSSPGQPPSESVYTDLQRRETEVYDRIQSEASSPPTSQGLLSQLCRPGQAAKLCAHICKLRTLRTFTS